MLCGSCLNDNALASALIRLGHDVALVPIYTPIRTDEEDVSLDRVFYGAISVYLEQRSALFRHTPWLVDRLLSSPRVLSWAAGRGTSIEAKELGDLTLSVLQGEHGHQGKELARLVAWLRDEYRPDLVHLSNSLLVGMARRMRQELGVPVLCSVQGEDIFLDELEEPYRSRVAETLRERAPDADGFISTSRFYVEHMAPYLGVPRERMHCVALGVNPAGFGTGERPQSERPFVIGYLARICPEKGLHLLVQALKHLVDDTGPGRIRLRVAGWLGPRDQAYFDGIMDQVREWGLAEAVEHRGEIDRAGKIEFLSSLHVLSVPTTYKEPKGRFVLEALASGVPVVEPRHGAFPEIIEATGGGLLVEPESPRALANGLRELLDDPGRRAELGRAGQAAVRRDYSDEAMARRTLAVYERYMGS